MVCHRAGTPAEDKATVTVDEHEVAAAQRLAALNPTAVDSDVAIAEAALAAQLWGEARAALARAIAAAGPAGPPRRLCLLMAQLEEAEYGQSERARAWLGRALDAPPDPTYVCAACGGDSAEWRALCPQCRSFDTLAWRRHLPAATSAVALAAVLPPEPGPPLLAAAAQSDK